MNPKYAHVAEYQYGNNGATTSKRVWLWSAECYPIFVCAWWDGSEIHHQISAVYGEECMSKSMVRHWVWDFEGERTEVHDLWSTS